MYKLFCKIVLHLALQFSRTHRATTSQNCIAATGTGSYTMYLLHHMRCHLESEQASPLASLQTYTSELACC